MIDIDRRIIRTYQLAVKHFNENHYNELLQMRMFVDFNPEYEFLRLYYDDLILNKGIQCLIPLYSLTRINWKRCLKGLEEIYNTSGLKVERDLYNEKN